MPKVHYMEAGGQEHCVDVAEEENLMRGAVDNGVEAIVGECGGGLACATCHCYVDDAWLDQIEAPSEDERDMLESTAAERRPNSRLSCQIIMTPELDGIVLHLPERQY